MRTSSLAQILAQALLTLAIVSILVFFVLRTVPGDPVDLMLGENAVPLQQSVLRHRLGLDKPLSAQWIEFARGLARADLGESLLQRRKVATLIFERLPNTLLLALAAAFLANAVGVPVGTWAAYRPKGALARASFALSTLFLALPTFWLGPLLVILFSLRWPWLPVSAFHEPTALILPALTLATGMTAVICRTTFAAVSACLGATYLQSARAKGASERRVLFFHALPNAATPVLMVSSLQFGNLLAGAVVTEAVFDWPGIGGLAFDAISSRDYPTVQGPRKPALRRGIGASRGSRDHGGERRPRGERRHERGVVGGPGCDLRDVFLGDVVFDRLLARAEGMGSKH